VYVVNLATEENKILAGQRLVLPGIAFKKIVGNCRAGFYFDRNNLCAEIENEIGS
jgi:hypothetical protein